MKTLRLLVAALLITTSLSAQSRYREAGKPVVYLFGVQRTTIVEDTVSGACRNQVAIDRAVKDYLETHRPGFQQSMVPQLIFSSRNNRVSFAVGGYVALRAGYDFDGIVDNPDFVTYDIPMPGNYDTRQKLIMDASTSRLYLKAVTNSNRLGRVVAYIETDFRGGAPGSYTPRLRIAYVQVKGFLAGRDVTTFCDLNSAPNTIDFQGPNSYNFNFATMIRYSRLFGTRFGMGIAAELPRVSGTYGNGSTFASLRQRVPDFPVYLEYKWGKLRDSHVRATAVIRDMYYHDVTKDKNYGKLGWGVQFSGNVKIMRVVNLMFNGVYGEGVTPYIQDLTGSGLDLVPDPENSYRLQRLPMWGWFAAAQIGLTTKAFISGGYSTVHVQRRNGYYTGAQYKIGQYVFGNIFYNVTPRFHCAVEYLWGTRENMDGMRRHANRIQALVRYNF